ncbi:unnamed protein product [Arabidopsis thaliana]|uniref:Uncharacterized protein n=1 Tax=Arabidopsis thaliana TaxID=3702 RepID=A0A5S9XZT4_ARATH|nr:unnamed protein product [Arabidopsis thaliana]VYS65184.1 unnamed protein product [Arabidopsis thaliana]
MSSAVDLGTRTGAAGCSRSVSDTTFWSVVLRVVLLQREQVINHSVTVFITLALVKQTLQHLIDDFCCSFHLLLKAPSEYLHEGQVFSRMPRATISGDESKKLLEQLCFFFVADIVAVVYLPCNHPHDIVER